MKSQSKAKKTLKSLTKIWKRAVGYEAPGGMYMVRTRWTNRIISFRKDRAAAIRYAKKLGYLVEQLKE